MAALTPEQIEQARIVGYRILHAVKREREKEKEEKEESDPADPTGAWAELKGLCHWMLTRNLN